MSQPNNETKHKKEMKRKAKNKKKPEPKATKQIQLDWSELKHLANLTFQDIARHHIVLGSIKEEFGEYIEKSEEISTQYIGLDRSYEDIVMQLIGLITEHSDLKNPPKTYDELLNNPEVLNKTVYREGKITKTEDILEFRSLESRYELLNYQLFVVANAVMKDIELKISSEYNKGRSKEEIQKDIETNTELLRTTKELLDAKKSLLETNKEVNSLKSSVVNK